VSLFLAEIETTTSEYNDDGPNKRKASGAFWRLVDAVDEEAAKDKVIAAFKVDDPYGTSVYVDVTIHPPL
jgi:hypothetical protein